MDKDKLQRFSEFITAGRIKDSVEISDSGYSQNEIEEILVKLEMDAQDALLDMENSQSEKENAVGTIRWIRTIRPKFDNDGSLSPDAMKKLIAYQK